MFMQNLVYQKACWFSILVVTSLLTGSAHCQVTDPVSGNGAEPVKSAVNIGSGADQQRQADQSADDWRAVTVLQSQAEDALERFNACYRSTQHALSEYSVFIAHLNKLIAKLDHADIEHHYLDALFPYYQSLGGPEDEPDKVSALVDPCIIQQDELRNSIDRQISIQKRAKPRFVAPTINFGTCVKPDYPRVSLRNEEQGTIRVAYLIEADGSLSSGMYWKSSGSPFLDRTAFDALKSCRFSSATFDGKSVRSWTFVDYVWTLPD